MTLEYLAMSFLKWEKRCDFVLLERCPRYTGGRPDVIGISNEREIYEVEIKRTIQDLKANAKKQHVRSHSLNLDNDPRWPKYFWFLVPHTLALQAVGMLPDYAGLLRGPTKDEVQCVHIVRKARANKAHQPLNEKEFQWLARVMGNQIIAQKRKIDHLQEQLRNIRTVQNLERPTAVV